MVVREGHRLSTTRSNIVPANTRRVIDLDCGGGRWGGRDRKTFLCTIERCLCQSPELYIMIAFHRTSFVWKLTVVAKVFPKSGDNCLWGSP